TVKNKEEIIKNSVKHIWKATEGKVVTITFDDPLNSATITLNNSNKPILNLNVPEVVLINEEIFRKIVNVVDGSNRKEPIIINEVEIRLQENDSEASVSVDQTLNYKESDNNAIGKDQGNEIQDLDSVAEPLNYEESDKNQENETQDLNSSIQVKLHANDEPVNNFIERVPSNLIEDSLPSVNEILNSSSTNIMKQTSDSFPTTIANTEFLSDNNL
ncbi:23002_t:CDS:2, partial [Racocetra persica]